MSTDVHNNGYLRTGRMSYSTDEKIVPFVMSDTPTYKAHILKEDRVPFFVVRFAHTTEHMQ